MTVIVYCRVCRRDTPHVYQISPAVYDHMVLTCLHVPQVSR